MKMKKCEFKKIIDKGLKQDCFFMAVVIETEGNKEPEIIINSKGNFVEKMRYYDQAYNDDMELINAKKNGKSIRIVDVSMINNLIELAWMDLKRIAPLDLD